MSDDLDALIVGTGFAGIGMAIALKKAGFEKIQLIEKEADVGGVWLANHYPGAACDIKSRLYSFSYEPKWDWSRKYAPQPEILAYLRHCADKYGVRPLVQFNREVSEADYDEAECRWSVRFRDGGSVRTRVLITATGQLSRPLTPKLPGIELFAGPQFHSARWDEKCDLRGKRVAVIGTGASAIQFVPEVAQQAKEVLVFQRSAPFVFPKPDRPYRSWELAMFRAFPFTQKLCRGVIFIQNDLRLQLGRMFGFVRKLALRGFEKYLAKQVADPELRAKLTPDYPLGCKRILISNNWYSTLIQPHVKVITDPIQSVTASGIRTESGTEHAADVLIYGTGFAATKFLTPMQIRGVGGVDLNAVWKDGAEAYLGMTVPSFPNFFMLYGPNTNLLLNSIVYMLESQINYVTKCLAHQRTHHLRSVEVNPAVFRPFNDDLQAKLQPIDTTRTCQSWYVTETGRNTTNWWSMASLYFWQTKRFDSRQYLWKA